VSDLKKYSYFPIRKNNHFRLLENSTQFYPAILDAINQAKSEIIIENYLTISGKIFDQFIVALIKAARRNVTVYCLFDSYGSKGISRNDLALLDTANINIQFYNRIKYQKYLRNLFRDHRKIFIIDQEQAFIGGAGISDRFDVDNKQGWHDVMLSIKGELIQDWFALFENNWNSLSDTPLNSFTNNSPAEQFTVNQIGQVIAYTAPHKQEIKRHLFNEVRKSKNSIRLTTPYFIPSRKFRRSLINAAERGVDVKLLLPGKITDHPGVRIMGQRYYAQLLRHGVKIFEYSQHFSHAKVLLCDQWCTIGSSNFDRWNFKWNLEANQTISDSNFVTTLNQWFQQELDSCDEITYQQWRNRNIWQRFKEWFWGGVVQLLEKLKRPSN